jgi:dihydrofolate synthase / folylpolyglutamate synthase
MASLRISSLAEAVAALEPYYPAVVRRPDTYTTGHVERLLAYLGDPQERMQVVHVAGTSGKTSTCYYVAALLHAAGKKVGHTVSPHLRTMNERVQIGLVPLPEKQFCEGLSEFLGLVEASGVRATFFEVITAFSFWMFARQGMEYAVIEVGMGGLLDATNVVRRRDKIAVITDIGLDHQRHLGQTLSEITDHKAGIIQLKNTVFCYRQDAGIMAPLSRRAAQMQADLHTFSGPSLPDEPVYATLPPFQQRNFYLALQAVSFLAAKDGFPLTKADCHKAAATHIPGRMDSVFYRGKRIILDGAHNVQKLRSLRESVRARHGYQPVAMLIAFIESGPDRLPPAAVEIAELAEHVIVTQPESDHPFRRFEDPALIAAFCKVHGQWSIEQQPELRAALDALAARPEPILVVTGSLHLLGAVYGLLEPAQTAVPEQG